MYYGKKIVYASLLGTFAVSISATGQLINCSPRSLTGCNYIVNNDFSPTSYDNTNTYHINDPFGSGILTTFGSGIVSSWLASHGTPNLYDPVNWPNLMAPPAHANNYFFCYAGTGSSIGNFSEGVVQKIPALQSNHTYILSFFKAREEYSPSYPIDNFNIYLMHCSDYSTYFTPIGITVPSIPTGSMQIYCETSVSNSSWEQVLIQFTAPSISPNYNMIWIFPQENAVNDRNAGMYFTTPELIDITNFSAGSTPTPDSDCYVTIGPTTPNCGPNGAVFTWHGPNGQTITAPSNQKIQIDASISTNVGTWTLKMTVPNRTVTNNSCSSQPTDISATVTVALCEPCALISPAGPITYYYAYESPQDVLLTCNSTTATSYQWYKNNVLISGATNQTYTISQQSYGFTDTNPHYYKCVTDCGTSNTVTFNHIPCFDSNDFPVSVSFQECKSSILAPSYLQLNAPYLGSGTVSTWWTELTNCLSVNSSGHLSFSGAPSCSASNPYYNGIFTKSSLPNGTETYMFYYHYLDLACRTPAKKDGFLGVQEGDKTIDDRTMQYSLTTNKEKSILIFPNPASSQINLSSNSQINHIRIFNLQRRLIKEVKAVAAKSVTVETANLKPGVYYCEVLTNKGKDVIKFIIQP